jgi:hypothetical protein
MGYVLINSTHIALHNSNSNTNQQTYIIDQNLILNRVEYLQPHETTTAITTVTAVVTAILSLVSWLNHHRWRDLHST